MASPSDTKQETRVLIVAFSSQGHLNPMLRFGKRLASKGIRVTLASTHVARQRILSSLTTTTTTTSTNSNNTSIIIPIAGSPEIRMEFFSDGLPLNYDRKSNLDNYMDCLGKFGPQSLSDLIATISDSTGGSRFSCIISNPFVPWVADVAAQHGIPCAMLWIQPCALFAIYYRFYNELNSFPTLTDPSMRVQLPGLPVLNTHDLPSFVLPSNPFGSFPRLFSDMFKTMKKIKWVLGNSFYELEKEVIESMTEICPIKPIGPLVPAVLLGDQESSDVGIDMWKPNETCIEWLDKKPNLSVVYVSFGSIAVLSNKQMKNLALGLKNSGRSFLWVVKPSDSCKDDSEFPLPPGFLEETEGKGLVVNWCPQVKVLMHPSIACFITHCGWNSTLETVASGVPVITFPQWSDQPTNAKLVTDVFEMGVRLTFDENGIVGSEEVERCIGEVMDGEKSEVLKNKATELKVAARKAVMENGSSDRNVQEFIDEISGLLSNSLLQTETSGP